VNDHELGFVASGELNSRMSRVLLQFALTKTTSAIAILLGVQSATTLARHETIATKWPCQTLKRWDR
jgi:hypothetical protein